MESTIERAAPSAIFPTETEAYQALLARAHRKTGAVTPEVVVRRVLAVTGAADWPVKREALEAVLRRVASGKSDGLQIVSRPGGGRLLGLYATRRKGSPARPYRTLLRGVEPVEGSCDCADFLRSSLGLCKHLLAVLEDVTSRPRAREKARREPVPSASPLRWDPVRPLTGPGDWLAQVRWVDGTPDRGLERWLRPAKGGGFTLEVPKAPGRRLQLVEELLGSLRDGRGEPALHALLQEDRRRIAVQGARDVDRLRGALRTLKQPLYPYQREAVERFLSSGRLLLADDMGLGKTAQAIAACHALWRSGRVRRGLVVAPAALKPQYRLGQSRPIDVYNLVSEPGIESRISDLVGTKQAFFTGLFDATTDEVAFERSGSFLSRIEQVVAPALPRVSERGAEAAEPQDGPAEREIDAIMAAGDESRDARPSAAPEPAPPASAADLQQLFSGLTVQRTPAGGLVIAAPPEPASALAALFAGMAQLLLAAAPDLAPPATTP